MRARFRENIRKTAPRQTKVAVQEDSSPRTRRYFRRFLPRRPSGKLFSAHAEVFPSTLGIQNLSTSLLRARGGISVKRVHQGGAYGSSPRTRRYFLRSLFLLMWLGLFSAHAEVFPSVRVTMADSVALLRARGGISLAISAPVVESPSSPRTRRYFPMFSQGLVNIRLFSAHAEVFPVVGVVAELLQALLRARGGISRVTSKVPSITFSSPRTRRYFQNCSLLFFLFQLFSAHAEVFPLRKARCVWRNSLLRARGGISETRTFITPTSASSPRTRRYFPSPRSA